jgi:flagellin
VTLTAADSSGVDHSISFSLSNADASNIDSALSTINTHLLQSNDSTLQQIVAVKDQSNNADGIRFISSLQNFTLSLGTTGTGTAAAGNVQGISNGTGPLATSQGGPIIASAALGAGATVDIASQSNAQNALTALTDAITTLGRAQAAVGKGENLFTYATNLAQSQLTNEAATESGIKDADLATEAANLSKAQILVQAGTAALAQANTAPQALLALLRQ